MTEMQEKAVKEWHNEGVAVAASYLRDEARLVELLCKMHENKGYLLYRAETLRQYAISLWNIPENAVYDLVTVAKKASEVPAMIDALRARKATVSKLRKVCPVIDFKNQKIWLDVVRHCSTREIEKCVAEAKPETDVKDSSIQKSASLVQMKTGVSVSTRDALELLRELKSQRDRKAASMGDVLAELAEMGLRKFDPVQKAKRAMDREERRNAMASAKKNNETKADSAHEATDIHKADYAHEITDTRERHNSHEPATAYEAESFVVESFEHASCDPRDTQDANVIEPLVDPATAHLTDTTEITDTVEVAHTVATTSVGTISDKTRTDEESVKSSLSRDVHQPKIQSKNNRNRIPARLVHLINLRDRRQCTQINLMGVRCPEQRWLDFHHIREVALGGKDELENLTTLCAAHHRLHHFRAVRR